MDQPVINRTGIASVKLEIKLEMKMKTGVLLSTKTYDAQMIATILRIGIGLLFIVGGWNKLYQLLYPGLVDGIVAAYTGPRGYINGFFSEFLFNGGIVTPWGFLTALSAFELLSGLALVAGFLVRPLALIYGFLLWSFVVSLPVSTEEAQNYLAPAALVQIRDIGLSGMLFVLFNLGSGKRAVDNLVFGPETASSSWGSLGLLLRLSVAIPLIVGGVFFGMADIKTFGLPGWLLLLTGFVIASGVGIRIVASVVVAMFAYYILTKLALDKSLIANLNAIKREIAFLAASAVLAIYGGGSLFTPQDVIRRTARAFSRDKAVESSA